MDSTSPKIRRITKLLINLTIFFLIVVFIAVSIFLFVILNQKFGHGVSMIKENEYSQMISTSGMGTMFNKNSSPWLILIIGLLNLLSILIYLIIIIKIKKIFILLDSDMKIDSSVLTPLVKPQIFLLSVNVVTVILGGLTGSFNIDVPSLFGQTALLATTIISQRINRENK